MTSKPWEIMTHLRQGQNLTQFELVKGLVSQGYLSRLEKGKLLPNETMLEQLAKRLNVGANWLISLWQPYYEYHRIRRQYWKAFCEADIQNIFELLLSWPTVLLDAEKYAYQSYCAIRRGEVEEATQYLHACISYTMEQKVNCNSIPNHIVWTSEDELKIRIIETRSQALIFMDIGRNLAAKWWNEQEKILQKKLGKRLDA